MQKPKLRYVKYKKRYYTEKEFLRLFGKSSGKVGRPRKKRGRPKGSKNKPSAKVGRPRKKRGRPKGSKNKKSVRYSDKRNF